MFSGEKNKFSLKKSVITMLALSSSVVFAGTMGSVCTPGDVTVPCKNSSWEFGVQALYLQPSYSIGSFLNIGHQISETSFASSNFNPNWGFGFKLDGAYHFSSGNDVDVNWYHYQQTTSLTLSAGSGGYIYDSFIGEEFATTILASIKPQWDAVNLELGQLVNLGDVRSVRFHGGLQYANIKTLTANKNLAINDISNVIDDFGGIVVFNSTNTMQFHGLGPRIGADLHYDWHYGFAFYANGAAALLVGSQKFSPAAVGKAISFDPFDPNGAIVLSPYSLNISGSTTVIVPELEAKVGATYSYTLAQGNLSIDAGWMWVNYFNGQQANSYVQNRPTDFSVQGPYIGLKWLGTI